MTYIKGLGIAIDQLLNALRGGSPDEALSAAAHRQRVKGHKYWGWTADFIDKIFFWDKGHCEASHKSEVNRMQLHKSYRE